MLFANLRIYKNVVKINYTNIIYQISQDLIDQYLKYSQCINQVEEYYNVLKVIITHAKRCYLLITFTNTNTIIDVLQIELCKINNIYQAI